MPNTPEIWRNEFTANTVTIGAQTDSTIIQLTNGNIVVLWTSDANLGVGSPTGTDIVGQVYDPLGNALGGEFRANGDISNDQRDFSATALDDGRFVVAYESDGGPFGISIQATELDTTITGAVSISGTRTIQTGLIPAGDLVGGPAVAGNTSDGSYVVAYHYLDDSASNTSTRFRHVDDTGVLGPVNNSSGTSSTFNQNVEISLLSNGNYVVVYQADGADDGIIFRLLNSSGTPGTGGFVADTNNDFDDDRDATVVGLANGGFVVAWQDTDADSDVQVQIYNNAGVEQGAHFNVNNGFGASDNHNEPHLIALADGGFVVAYDDESAGLIRGQRFDATGIEVGSEFIITNSETEWDPSGFGLADGRFVVGWTTNEGIPIQGTDIEIEFYDTRDNTNDPAVYSPDEWQVGTVGNDVFTADGNTEFVHGWNGNDTITDGSNVESIFGDSGNDTIVVTSNIQADSFHGGSGNDTIDWSGSSESGAVFDLAAGTAANSTATASEDMTSFENLIGTNNADSIIGTNGANSLSGGAGDDIITGGAGNDQINGGSGTDLASYALGGAVTVNLGIVGPQNTGGAGTDTLTGIENLGGSGFGDTLVGDNGANALYGRGGSDIVTGGGGHDRLFGDAGNDVLNGGSGNDELSGGFSQDVLNGGSGADRLDGGFGNDTINGGVGVDTALYEGFGGGITVNLNVAGGQNTGAAGVDTLISIENLIGADFNDRFTGTTGANTMQGRSGSDQLFGIGGDDLLIGNGGNDNIQGGGGNDTINGGTGRDIMRGGGGDDLFVYTGFNQSAVGGQRDRIDNFSRNGVDGNDTVDLSGIDANTLLANDQAFNFINTAGFSGSAGELRQFNAPNRRIVEGDVDGDAVADFQIEFFNFNTNLIASDFVF